MPEIIDTPAAAAAEAKSSRDTAAALRALEGRLSGERWLTACAAVGALLLLSMLARPLWTGRIPECGDLGLFHLPLRDFYSRCLKNGQAFDWMPGLYTGLFLTGEGEHGPYHPLHLLLYRLLPLDVAFALDAFVAYPFLLLGTFVFLRRHAGATGALLAGTLYTFSANNLYHGNHPNLVAVMAHLPWLLWLLECVALRRGPRRRLAAAGVALLTGSQLLMGHPQAMSWCLLAEALYAGFLFRAAPQPLRASATWAGAKILGLGIGAVQVLSTLALLAVSNRDSFDPLFGAFVPKNFLQILVPNLTDHCVPEWWDEPFYFGVAAVVLLCWWLAARWSMTADSGVRRLTGFAVVLGVLTAWLATGTYGRLYLVQTKLPLVGQFRGAARYVNLTAFAGAVLAGLAFGRLAARVREHRPLPWRTLIAPWLAAAAAVAAAAAFQIAFPPPRPRFWDPRFRAGILIALGAAVSLTLAARGRAIGLYGLLLLAVYDLREHSLRNPTCGAPLWKDTPTLAEFNAANDPPPCRHQGRIYGITGAPIRLLLQGERLVNGYWGGIEPRKWLDYLTVNALRVAGTGWYREMWTNDTSKVPGLEPFGRWWYRVPRPLPHVRLVSRARVSAEPARDLQDIDVDTTALVTHPIRLEEGDAGTAVLTDEKPGELHVRVEAPGRQLLVLAESYDPGWQAFVDGVPVTAERINGDFMGCAVEAGPHDVHFIFRPASLRYGRVLSLFSLAVALVIAGVSGVQMLSRSRRAAGALGPAGPCE
jgi:hypothetical protein